MGKKRRTILRGVSTVTGLLGMAGTTVAEEDVEPWKQNKVYRDEDRVTYGGYEWQAHWYTQGEEPADTAAVWNRIGRLKGTASHPRWSPEGVYRAGNRVVYENAVWESNWWNENESPTIDGNGPWSQVRTIDNEKKSEDNKEHMSQTPVEMHGQLQVIGTELCNEDGSPVQLSGMSTHGIQWFGWEEFLTPGAFDALANDWNADLCRVAMYVQEGGYETDPEGFTAEVNRIVEEITKQGMYAIIDFHILDPGNPLENLEHAKTFFDAVATEHAEKDNVIFEICNEPNNTSWESIKQYAETVIPIIRNHDQESPIVVGTRGWSSLGFADIGPDGPQEIVDNPVKGEHILYAYHFYAATHGQWEREQLDAAADQIPIFVTECGTTQASGDAANDISSAEKFLTIMEEHSISWAFWSYSDDWRTSGIWKESKEDNVWAKEELTESGRWMRSTIRDR